MKMTLFFFFFSIIATSQIVDDSHIAQLFPNLCFVLKSVALPKASLSRRSCAENKVEEERGLIINMF